EQYARAILAVEPGVTDDQVGGRLAVRLARQAVLARDDPPAAWFLVDEAVLHRCVGSADVMAAQLAHLGGVARLPSVTIQVVLVRDTAERSGPVLRFTADAWRAFTAAIR